MVENNDKISNMTSIRNKTGPTKQIHAITYTAKGLKEHYKENSYFWKHLYQTNILPLPPKIDSRPP